MLQKRSKTKLKPKAAQLKSTTSSGTQMVNIYDAKTQLSKLVSAAHSGEVIVISRHGEPMAKLVALDYGTALETPGWSAEMQHFLDTVTYDPDGGLDLKDIGDFIPPQERELL